MTEKVKIFDNFDALVGSVRKHNQEIEGDITIIPANSPLDLLIGFACVETEQAWQIKIKDIKKWAAVEREMAPSFGEDGSLPKPVRAELVSKAIMTNDGAHALAQALSNLK